MGNNDNILTALQLHNNRLEPNHHITITLPTPIAIIILVVIAGAEILRIQGFDFGIGEAVADARVELVEGFPFEFGGGDGGGSEVAGGLDGALQGRGPDCEGLVGRRGFADEGGEGLGVEFAAGRDGCVAADFAVQVVFGFAVLG